MFLWLNEVFCLSNLIRTQSLRQRRNQARRMYWRRASIQGGQAITSTWWRHCSETGFPR